MVPSTAVGFHFRMDRNRPPPCPPEPPPLFYNHFRDKYEAMAYVLRRGVDAQAALIGGFAGHDRRELAALLCRYVKGHRALIVNMISYNQQNSIHEFMVEYGSLSLENEIKEKTGLKTIPDDVRHSIDIWTRGALGYGLEWIKGGCKEDPEDVARTICDSIPSLLLPYLESDR
ncbi:TetR-like C-terminal domain-containing protein [Rubneribacter sp.]|nr:TetR family transcriptional regulator C-terminal domain-containing protein [Candidatus Rubneribacter avistercoris]